MSSQAIDPEIWEVLHYPDTNQIRLRCRLCDTRDTSPREPRNTTRHLQASKHRDNLARWQDQAPTAPTTLFREAAPTAPGPSFSATGAWASGRERADLFGDAQRALLGSLYDTVIAPLHASHPDSNAGPYSATHEDAQRRWGVHYTEQGSHSFDSEVQQELSGLVGTLLDMNDAADFEFDLPSSDSEYDSDEPLHELPDDVEFDDPPEEDEDPPEENDDESGPNLSGAANNAQDGPRKRARASHADPESPEWYPWKDKITCTLDILMHLPRSVFSQRQLDLFLWLLRENNVNDVPSVRSMQLLNERLQKLCGIDTVQYKGAHGNIYHVNKISQIIAQEMANPNVRPHLSFYPDDSGKKVSEACQGQRWMNEMPDDLAPPMIRLDTSDYYLYEPTILMNHPEAYCVPHRWFTREGHIFAKCWKLIPAPEDDGWLVAQDQFEVHHSQLLMNFPEFCEVYERYNVPNPRHILGVVPDASTSFVSEWTLSDPAVGNSWRAQANGRRVLSFPIWMYCDDTSGNISKKWNKHNSFLFTPAGLSRNQTHKEYNIHFLCTSNLAAPLEMLDGIADQIASAQETGIAAWDHHFEEDVLVIPWVLALLGDNPMQSEFACHIGLRGKYFCRVCKVMGKTRDREGGNEHDPAGHEDEEDENADDSDDSDGSTKPKARSKFAETFEQVRSRILSFIEPGPAREKAATLDRLSAMFNEAVNVGSETRVKKMRTAAGLKDTYQQVFLDRLFASQKKHRTNTTKAEALKSCIKELPDRITSPVWTLEGLDPHQDTPVEILHVVLLGFIKYMWRDVLKVQLHNKKAKLEELEHKISSFDTRGLGIPALNGHTLVTYGLSLTGRDFRAIAQIAPFVLEGMISPESYETWLCLSKLVPLIWQPEIPDIDDFVRTLEHEITSFLTLAARWTSRWFNKPKFHILVHLPSHIRRFGPAILFATEAFESFNAVIRGKSIHSNRLAPSRDIARAFAQGNRVRHLLSGGRFYVQEKSLFSTTVTSVARNCGPGPLRIVNAPRSTIADYLGFAIGNTILPFCVNSTEAPLRFPKTQTGALYPDLDRFTLRDRHRGRFQTAKELIVANGDRIRMGEYIIAVDAQNNYAICQLVEVLRVVPSDSAAAFGNIGLQQPDSILVNVMRVTSISSIYKMPTLVPSGQMGLVEIQNIMGSANVPHDCASNKCGLTGTREVYQERTKTTKTVPIMEHKRNPSHRILNVTQMHNIIHLAPFRCYSPILERAEFHAIIDASARQEAESQAKAARKKGPRAFSRPNSPAIPRTSTPIQSLPFSTQPRHSLPRSNLGQFIQNAP